MLSICFVKCKCTYLLKILVIFKQVEIKCFNQYHIIVCGNNFNYIIMQKKKPDLTNLQSDLSIPTNIGEDI